MRKRKLLMALVGACLACNVAMATTNTDMNNGSGSGAGEYMGQVSVPYIPNVQDVSVVDSGVRVEKLSLSKQMPLNIRLKSRN